MANYVVTTDFAAKDALPTGNPAKTASGTQVDTEFDNIAVAIATKEDTANKGATNGYASLVTGTVPSAQISAASVTQHQAALAIAGSQVADNGITNTKLADMAQATIKGRANGAGTGDPTDLTATQVLTILQTVDGTGSGLDADLLDGLQSASAATVSTVMLRDSAGDTAVRYVNLGGSNGENPTISQVVVTNGTDGNTRKATLAHLKTSLALPKMAWGQISSAGALSGSVSSAGVTSVTRNSLGDYSINVTAAGFTATPSVTVTQFGSFGDVAVMGSTSSTSISVNTLNGVTDGLADRSFFFIAVGV